MAVVVCPQTGHGFTADHPFALAASQTIDLKGHEVILDSFDSGDPNYSNNGLYDPAKSKDTGDVRVGSGLVDSFNIGNLKILGRLSIGPEADISALGPYTLAPSSVGSKAWVQGGNVGIQPGYCETNPGVAFGDAYLPTAGFLPPGLANQNHVIGGVFYALAFFTSGDYVINGLPGGVYVDTNASVRLWIKGNVNLSGGSAIRIAPNASLQIYMEGSTFSLSGGARIDNQSGHAERFCLFGLPTCTSIFFGANDNFYGCVYAPQADFAVGGGGIDAWHYVGAWMAKSLTMYGHYNFHYDENLERVATLPPSITAQPQSQTVLPGSNAVFSVTAQWAPAYQWQFNGTAIVGETNSSLVLTNVGPEAAGGYSVVLTNALGYLTSSVVPLVVQQPAARLGSPGWSASQRLRFSVSGLTNAQYVIEGSSNLKDWMPLVTNAAPFDFEDPEAAVAGQRYYRARWVR